MHEMSDDQARMSELYDRYFTVIPATSPEVLDAAHALRYQVYCVEHPFLDASQHPTGREVDRHDPHSVHAVLINKSAGEVVGCVRLVLPQAASGLAEMPMRELLGAEARARLDACDPLRTAEISRYAVSKTLRRREGEELYPDVALGGDDDELPVADFRRLAPHLSVGLLRGVAALAAEHGITKVCAAMAPALLRLLRRFGLVFESLGPPIEYHGLRQPCMADCEA